MSLSYYYYLYVPNLASLWLASHAGVCWEGWKTSSPKNPAWEVTLRDTFIRKLESRVKSKDFTLSSRLLRISHFMKKFSYFTRKFKTNHRTINRQFEFERTKSYSMTCFFLKRRNVAFRVLSICYSCSLWTASLFTDPLFSLQSPSSAGDKI